MHKKSKLPKISDKQAAEIIQAAKFAYGNKSVDDFMERVFASILKHRKRCLEREEQSFAE